VYVRGMDRRDLLGECNVDRHPLDTFISECCASCFNPECTRSLSGKLKFDKRTNGWFDHYFGDQDKMDPSDPRFSKIAAQKFVIIDPARLARTPEVGSSSAWVDPRDLERPAAPKPPERSVNVDQQLMDRPPPPPQVQASPAPAAPTAPAEPPPPAPRVPGLRRDLPHHLLLANTPSKLLQSSPPLRTQCPPPLPRKTPGRALHPPPQAMCQSFNQEHGSKWADPVYSREERS
jgi:hypothetical protein